MRYILYFLLAVMVAGTIESVCNALYFEAIIGMWIVILDCLLIWIERRERVQIVRREGSVRKQFDAKKFEAEHSDMYAEYVTESATKSSITIKIKEQ